MIKRRARLLGGMLILAAVAALTLTAAPVRAHAEFEVSSGSLQQAFDDHPTETAFTISGGVGGCNIPSGKGVTVKAGGSLSMDGCANAGALTVSGGSVTGDFYNTGTVNGACGGIIYHDGGTVSSGNRVYIPIPSSLAGASALYQNGGFGDQVPTSNGYYDSSATITGAIIGKYYYDVSGSSARLKSYTISYYYGDGKGTAMSLSASYPTVYAASTSDLVIPAAPNQEGYAFGYWAYNNVDSGKTFRIAAGTMENIVLYSYWNKAFASGAGASGGAMSSVNGGGSGAAGAAGTTGAAGALVSGSTTDDDDDDDTVAATVTSPTGSNGMRVRTANATTRHAFSATDDDVETRASSQRRTRRFPWQWVGVGLGGAVLLVAGWIMLRRRLAERDAALLEKLNIHDG